MSVKVQEIRGMAHDDKLRLLADTRGELMHERGLAAMGGAPKNPGRIRQLRRTIARILTLVREEEFRTGAQLTTVARRAATERAPEGHATTVTRKRGEARARARTRERTAHAQVEKSKSAKVGSTKSETSAAKEKIKKGSKRVETAQPDKKRTPSKEE